MFVPFALGRVIDVIYTKDSDKMRDNLNKLCLSLTLIFVVGAICNFGRVYLINLSGRHKKYFEVFFKLVHCTLLT